MTPAEKASVARVHAMEWERLSRLTRYPPVKQVCQVKSREAWQRAEQLEQNGGIAQC